MKSKTWMRRLLAGILVIMMVAGVWLTTVITAVASTNGHTREETVEWVLGQEGKGTAYIPANGLQCVDLIKYYQIYLGQPAVSIGYAYNYYRSYDLPAGWHRYTNSQANPEPGDIVVFDANAYGRSATGHVGIVYAVDSQKYYFMDYNGGNNNERGTRRNMPLKNFTCVIRPEWPVSIPQGAPMPEGAPEPFLMVITTSCLQWKAAVLSPDRNA